MAGLICSNFSMKSSRLFLVVVFVTAGFLLASYTFRDEFMGEHVSISTLLMPMAENDNPRDADPAHILFNTTWGHLENLASPLVEWSPEGQIRSGAAQSFEWHGDELHLHMRDNYRTVDGVEITADDAAFSLKRLIVLAKNTHGFIADFLCGDKDLKSVSDDCQGIKVKGNTLILVPLRGKDFLLRMLAAMDFVVLLRSQVDPETLAIISFRNTSGPYRLEEDQSGDLSYVANKSHWHYSARMPQKADLVRYNPKAAPRSPSNRPVFELLADGKTDIVINFSSDRPDLYLEASRSVPGVSLVPTLDIGRLIAVFTPRGISELSRQQRIAIGKAIRAAVIDVIVKDDGVNKPVEQFFASFGDGSLTSAQLNEVRLTFDAVEADQLGDGIRIALPGSMTHLFSQFKSKIPHADCRMDTIDYIDGVADGEPHVYIISTDTGWTEDLGLLSYAINMKYFFPSDQTNGQNWLREYVDIEDKETRLESLRLLHLKALTDPWVVPIASQEYFTLVRSPWTYHGPKLFNSGALWHLRHP